MKNISEIKKIDFSNKIQTNINTVSKQDIAVVGISARFAGMENYDEFWNALVKGEDCITELSSERKDYVSPFFLSMGTKRENLNYEDCSDCAFLDDIGSFDHQLFHISPREAALMDPAQKLFLEAAFHAVEDAGYGGKRLAGTRTGVFVGYSSDFGIDYKNYIQMIEPSFVSLATSGNIKSIIAGRISYLLDLKGPSMLIDTACSSSLVAVHTACNSIKNGECDAAIAGGVKIMILPKKTDRESEVRIESSDGRARTFDDSSDGTGSGEGTGAVLLKPLYRAIKDGDYIYAVIKGSAVNQDGTSVGITAPNSNAQEEVIRKAWNSASIDPETVTYIEAHGTGTKLGDPIEVGGITGAFRKYTDKKQFCAVGSVKSNLGHLDSAAGIAGLIKCILSLKHKKLAPTLHFKLPNRKIAFEDSPLYVSDSSVEWKSGETPRRCGISSFGLSGTNCHIVLEEGPHTEDRAEHNLDHHVFVLSSKSEYGLLDAVKANLNWLECNPSYSIRDICYTAALGRGHYEYRIVFVIKSRRELVHKLQFVANNRLIQGSRRKELDGIYYGTHFITAVKRTEEVENRITSEEKTRLSKTAEEMVKNYIKSGRQELLYNICTHYVNGADLSWSLLYNGANDRNIPLPGYQMQKRECWLDLNENMLAGNVRKGIPHPLFNNIAVSSFDRTIYETLFHSSTHWVLKDHKIRNRYVMPGTAYIEMLRELGVRHYGEVAIQLNHIVFLTPLSVGDGDTAEVQTILVQKDDDSHDFMIYSRDHETDGWKKHAEGNLSRSETTHISKFDVSSLKIGKEYSGANHEKVDGTSDFIRTGGRWKNIKEFYVGKEEVLVRLQLPEQYTGDMKEYGLHPALMDNGVNFAIQGIEGGNYLPWTYQSIIIYGNMPSDYYSYLKKTGEGGEKETITADIWLMDKNGVVFCEIKGYIIKRVNEKKQNTIFPEKAKSEADYYQLEWTERDFIEKGSRERHNLLIIDNSLEDWVSRLKQSYLSEGIKLYEAYFDEKKEKSTESTLIIEEEETDDKKLILWMKEREIGRILYINSVSSSELSESEESEIQFDHDRMQLIGRLYRVFHRIVKNGYGTPLEFILVGRNAIEVTGSERRINPLNYAAFQLTRVIAQEQDFMICRCIDMDEDTGINLIKKEIDNGDSLKVAYRKNIRYEESIHQLELAKTEEDKLEIKSGGVYLITGGTGGIGLNLGKYLSEQAEVKIVLLSRTDEIKREDYEEILHHGGTEKQREIVSAVLEMEKNKAEVIFVKADITVKEKLEEAFVRVRSKFGKINGVIHCAGEAGDGFIFRKEESVFQRVIAPKIKGSWNLDQCIKVDKPDFLILFSSIVSILGTPGQSDYATGNAFMDSFGTARNKKGMKTIVINWPLWLETGMAKGMKHINDSLFEPFEAKDAVKSLDQILRHGITNVIPGRLHGFLKQLLKEHTDLTLTDLFFNEAKRDKLRQSFKKQNNKLNILGKHSDQLTESEIQIAEILGSVLMLNEVDIYETFTELGGDSIIAVRYAKELGNLIPDLIDVTDIFTYPTVFALAEYVDRKQSDKKTGSQNREVKKVEDIMEMLAQGKISVEEARNLREFLIEQ